MASGLFKKTKTKTRTKARGVVSMNDFLDRVITSKSNVSIDIINNPKTEVEKEYVFIAAKKLGTLKNIKMFVDYLHSKHLEYSRAVLQEFMALNNIVDANLGSASSSEDEEPEPQVGKKKKPRAREFRDADEFREIRDEGESGSGSDSPSESEPSSSENEEEDDDDISPKLPPAPPPRRDAPPPTDERTRLENERILMTQEDKATDLRLEAAHKLRRENPSIITEEALDAAICKVISSAKARKDEIRRSEVLPNIYFENLLKSQVKLTEVQERQLNNLVQDRERFERKMQSVIPVRDQPYTNRIRHFYKVMYRNAEWMRVGDDKFVSYTCIDREFLPDCPPIPRCQIAHIIDGQFRANNLFFSIMATANNMIQDGKFTRISSSVYNGSELSVIIKYVYNDGSVVDQDEVSFERMQKYIKMLGAPTNVRKDAAVEEKFSLHNTSAIALGASKLSFPGGVAVAQKIANHTEQTSGTVRDYFRAIITISAYLTGAENKDSVFKQRLVAGWFSGTDLTSLSAGDKIDYEELVTYYETLIDYQTDAISLLYFSSGGKFIKLSTREPVRPVIVDENTDYTKIVFPPMQGGVLINIVGIDLNGKPQIFVDKIKKINATVTHRRSYHKTLWNIVEEAMDVLKSRKSLDGWVPTLLYRPNDSDA